MKRLAAVLALVVGFVCAASADDVEKKVFTYTGTYTGDVSAALDKWWTSTYTSFGFKDDKTGKVSFPSSWHKTEYTSTGEIRGWVGGIGAFTIDVLYDNGRASIVLTTLRRDFDIGEKKLEDHYAAVVNSIFQATGTEATK